MRFTTHGMDSGFEPFHGTRRMTNATSGRDSSTVTNGHDAVGRIRRPSLEARTPLFKWAARSGRPRRLSQVRSGAPGGRAQGNRPTWPDRPLSEACETCHSVYRDKPDLKSRCLTVIARTLGAQIQQVKSTRTLCSQAERWRCGIFGTDRRNSAGSSCRPRRDLEKVRIS